MHTRTLSRRLNSFGVGFQQLVDETRFEIARQMLEHSAKEVGDIAELLDSRGRLIATSSHPCAFTSIALTRPASGSKCATAAVTDTCLTLINRARRISC